MCFQPKLEPLSAFAGRAVGVGDQPPKGVQRLVLADVADRHDLVAQHPGVLRQRPVDLPLLHDGEGHRQLLPGDEVEPGCLLGFLPEGEVDPCGVPGDEHFPALGLAGAQSADAGALDRFDKDLKRLLIRFEIGPIATFVR